MRSGKSTSVNVIHLLYNSGMQTKPKIATSYRLSPRAVALLAQLSRRTGLTRSACLELAIRELDRQVSLGQLPYASLAEEAKH